MVFSEVNLLIVGKPYLRLWQGEQKTYYPLSISHEEDYVVAVVITTPVADPEWVPELQSPREVKAQKFTTSKDLPTASPQQTMN